jgi:hypothetical protein
VAERRLSGADALVDDGRPDRALGVLEEVTVAFKGTEWGEEAARKLAELRQDASVRAVVDVQNRVTRMLRKLKPPVGEKERESVLRALRRTAKNLEGDAKTTIEHWIEIFEEKWVPKRS